MSGHDWDRWWEQFPLAEIDFLTALIFREMGRAVSFSGKSVLELGCGTGRLSLLALRAGAARATMVDASSRALEIAKSLLAGEGRTDFVRGDFRELDLGRDHDIVFSSGVVEHFPEPEILEVMRIHERCSLETVLTVVPAGPHYNNLRMRKPETVRNYGWQRPLSRRNMRSLFRQAGIEPYCNRRFHPLYAVPRLHDSHFLHRILRPLERFCGGLLITAGRVPPPGNAPA